MREKMQFQRPMIRIKTARIDAGISQIGMARTLKMSRWTYAAREENPEKFTMEQADIISKMVNRRIDELIFLPSSSTIV